MENKTDPDSRSRLILEYREKMKTLLPHREDLLKILSNEKVLISEYPTCNRTIDRYNNVCNNNATTKNKKEMQHEQKNEKTANRTPRKHLQDNSTNSTVISDHIAIPRQSPSIKVSSYKYKKHRPQKQETSSEESYHDLVLYPPEDKSYTHRTTKRSVNNSSTIAPHDANIFLQRHLTPVWKDNKPLPPISPSTSKLKPDTWSEQGGHTFDDLSHTGTSCESSEMSYVSTYTSRHFETHCKSCDGPLLLKKFLPYRKKVIEYWKIAVCCKICKNSYNLPGEVSQSYTSAVPSFANSYITDSEFNQSEFQTNIWTAASSKNGASEKVSQNETVLNSDEKAFMDYLNAIRSSKTSEDGFKTDNHDLICMPCMVSSIAANADVITNDTITNSRNDSQKLELGSSEVLHPNLQNSAAIKSSRTSSPQLGLLQAAASSSNGDTFASGLFVMPSCNTLYEEVSHTEGSVSRCDQTSQLNDKDNLATQREFVSQSSPVTALEKEERNSKAEVDEQTNIDALLDSRFTDQEMLTRVLSPMKPAAILHHFKLDKYQPLRPSTQSSDSASSMTSSYTSFTPYPIADLEPVHDAANSVDLAIMNIKHKDWNIKCQGLELIRRLTLHHPDLFKDEKLDMVCWAIVQEVKNLRTQVCRLAITCLGELFLHFKRRLDAEGEKVVLALLNKAGDPHGFMQDCVDKALVLIINNLSPYHALGILLNTGVNHRNSTARKTTSYFVADVCHRLGPDKVLNGPEDLTDRILVVACTFLLESLPETRYNGQKILWELMSHEDFDRMLHQHVPDTILRNVNHKLNILRNKGLDDRPVNRASSKIKMLMTPNYDRSCSVGSATCSEGVGSPKVTHDPVMDVLNAICKDMKGKNWRVRYDGITAFRSFVFTKRKVAVKNVSKVFDKFIPCLRDSNSKVIQHALNTMKDIAPLLLNDLGPVLSLIVKAVAPNLTAKKAAISETANDILHLLTNPVEMK